MLCRLSIAEGVHSAKTLRKGLLHHRDFSLSNSLQRSYLAPL